MLQTERNGDSMQVQGITVADYRKTSYVKYTLLVRARTTYMHSSAFYDPDACLMNDWPLFALYSRFSELRQLHHCLQTQHKTLTLPAFPPKRWLGNRNDSFLQARVQMLTTYFAQLLEIPQVQVSPILLDFCRPVMELMIGIAGIPQVGKLRLVEGFFTYSPSSYHTDLPSFLNRKESQIDGSKYHFPIDVVIRKRLLRLISIDIIQLDESTEPEVLESTYQGIIFAYSNELPDSFERVREMRAACKVPSVLVGLDHAGDPGFASYSAECVGDAYEVFEQLLNDVVPRS